jgi:hypothetical protein
MLNVAVPKVRLQCPRVVPLVRQGITASVPNHVRVRLEAQLGLPARALDHAGETSGAERCPTFRGEPARTPRPPTPPKVALNGSAHILPSNTPGTPSAHGNWRARDDSNIRTLPQEPPPNQIEQNQPRCRWPGFRLLRRTGARSSAG